MSDDPFGGDTRPRRGQFLFALIFLAFALFILSQLGNQTTWVEKTKLAAQPRFWPGIAAVGMTLAAVFHLKGLRRRKFHRTDWVELRIWAVPLEYCLWFMAYVFLVPVIGYLPATLVFMPALTWRLGYRSRFMIATSLAFAVAVVILFKGLLSVKIPGGAIYEWLPDGMRSFFIIYL